MSHTSRAERSDSTHYNRGGRSGSSNQQRYFSGSASTKGGGSASASNPRSAKKYNNNASGGHSRARSPNVNTDSSDISGAHAVQNGAHLQQLLSRATDVPVASLNVNVRLSDIPAQNLNPAPPRAPSSNAPSVAPPSITSTASSEAKPPTTPAKSLGDTSKSFPLQFGSISPGFMNGMQIPARTNSAPPNLDEQKKDQAHHDPSSAGHYIPIPPIPKQHLPKKDVGILNQPNAVEAQPVNKSRRDFQVSASPPVAQTHKPSVLSIPGMHMQLPFHQSHVSAQYGGPNPQIQSQPISGTSLGMPLQVSIPMPLPMGNPQVQQPIFVPGLQPHQHPVQSQGMMHQGQTLNFPSQMGPQMPPHLGNMGMNMVPQFPQQQAGKIIGSRKQVKITHPDTHEELRLDDSPGLRPHSNVPPQSQPVPPFSPNYPMNFFPNSYNTSLFFPAVGSVPLNSTQVPPTSQPPRFYNQVAGKQAVGSRGEKELLPPTSSLSVVKTEYLKPSTLLVEDPDRPPKEFVSSSSSSPRSKPGLDSSSVSGTSSGPINVENDVLNISTSASVATNGAAITSVISTEESNVVVVPDSIKDKHKKSDNRDLQDQIGRQPMSLSSLPSQHSEAEAAEAKSTLSETNSITETAKEFLSTSVAASSEACNLTGEGAAEQKTSDASKILGTKDVKSIPLNFDEMVGKEQGEAIVAEQNSLDTSLRLTTLESSYFACKTENSSNHEVATTSYDLLEHAQQKSEEILSCNYTDIKVADDVYESSHSDGCGNIQSSVSMSNTAAQEDRTSTSDVPLSMPASVDNREVTGSKPAAVDRESAPDFVPSPGDDLKCENEDNDLKNGGYISSSPAIVVDKSLSDINIAKSIVPRGKKKMKELYRKAEAAGTSSDIYVAYKGPEEKKYADSSTEGTESTSNVGIKQASEILQENDLASEKLAPSKVEPDDWEDAAEIPTPQLETSKNENQGYNEDGDGLMTKRHSYTRDFLLKFCEQCTDLPDKFELTSDIADALMVSNVPVSYESYPSPGQNIDRPTGGARLDRRGIGLGDDDKWSKFPGSLVSGRGDMRTDIGYVGNVAGLRIGQAGNYGVLRNPRAPTPIQYAGGILSGPMQSLSSQGSLQRNNSDSDKWQRGTGFQRGLIPSPQTALQVMHKAEKKYEVGKVTDEEEAKQRHLKAILNKLTPQNFQKLFEQVKQVNIDNVITLSGVISQIFDKALMEPTFCEMYANFCFHLAADLPELRVDNKTVTFRRLLLNECQEEFERGEREEEEANKAEEEGECKLTAEEREDKRLQARRRMLGNIRLIGELYKKKMLSEKIMHECINKLLGQNQTPDEENIEALCKLMSTIGEMIDHPKAKEHMDAYFDIMSQLSNNLKLSSRVRFMLKDVIDLRKNNWLQRRKVEGPKMIEEVHRDAAQERQAQAGRLGCAPSFGGPIRRGTPMDFAPRAPNMLLSPSAQMGGFRAAPPQLRGYGSQDVRIEERHSFENRAMSVPLPQRPLGDESITLGPQGGLARGMAYRGQQSASSIPLAEMPSPGYTRRMGHGLNGFNSTPDQTTYSQREDVMPRNTADRISAPSIYEQSYSQGQSVNYGNGDIRSPDYGSDRSMPVLSPSRGGPFGMQDVSCEMAWSEEQLRAKSMSTIKEYYSARDQNEVALCIKDLNTPTFYPSMISLWVSDCFERKDMERDLLTKLLINLTKPQDGLISEDQLIKGFEFVLAVLEDSVNDAPRAAEFLGRILAQVILENVIALSEIGQLIYEGGEEQGRLVEIGLAAEVLGCILDVIKSEKGDSFLKEIRSSSKLQLENFRPPGSKKSWSIDKFI